MEKTEQEYMKEAMDALCAWEKDLSDHTKGILDEICCSRKDFSELMDGSVRGDEKVGYGDSLERRALKILRDEQKKDSSKSISKPNNTSTTDCHLFVSWGC